MCVGVCGAGEENLKWRVFGQGDDVGFERCTNSKFWFCVKGAVLFFLLSPVILIE